MADQTEVLRVLVACKNGSLEIDGIMNALGLGGKAKVKKERKRIIANIGRLMQNKLAARAFPVALDDKGGKLGEGFATYQATVTGRALIAAGGKVKSGPRGKHNGARRPVAGTMRSRLWEALRFKKKATVPELLELCRRESDGDADKIASNAHLYLKRLARVGIVAIMQVREKGHAPSSNGFRRYALLRDLGPQAPTAGTKWIFDPNARLRIPYPVEKR